MLHWQNIFSLRPSGKCLFPCLSLAAKMTILFGAGFDDLRMICALDKWLFGGLKGSCIRINLGIEGLDTQKKVFRKFNVYLILLESLQNLEVSTKYGILLVFRSESVGF